MGIRINSGGGGGGITNGAGANVIPKSDGTNLVASRITDNGTDIVANSGAGKVQIKADDLIEFHINGTGRVGYIWGSGQSYSFSFNVVPGTSNSLDLGAAGGGGWRTGYFDTSVRTPKFETAAGVHWTSGAGSPEGTVTANVGSLYTRTNGGAGTTLYVKESGAGNTGWVAK